MGQKLVECNASGFSLVVNEDGFSLFSNFVLFVWDELFGMRSSLANMLS